MIMVTAADDKLFFKKTISSSFVPDLSTLDGVLLFVVTEILQNSHRKCSILLLPRIGAGTHISHLVDLKYP